MQRSSNEILIEIKAVKEALKKMYELSGLTPSYLLLSNRLSILEHEYADFIVKEQSESLKLFQKELA